MNDEIFCQEYLCNSKSRKNQVNISSCEKVNYNSDRGLDFSDTKFLKNKRVSKKYFIIFLISYYIYRIEEFVIFVIIIWEKGSMDVPFIF